MLLFRRREARKVAKLARVLTALDEQARLTRRPAKRVARVSLGL
jgi:hypothetical protein